MRRARHIPLLLMFAARSLTAQWHASADVGLARIQQPAIPESNAQTVGLNADVLGSRFRVLGSGLGARASEGRWTVQGLAAASMFGALGARARWELAGVTTVFAETNAQTASSAEVLARGYFGTLEFGSSLGAGVGTRVADAGRQPLARALTSAWLGTPFGRVGAELSHVRTSTTPFVGQRITLTYTDASASWRHEVGRLSAGAVVGVRTSNNQIVPDGGWGAVDAQLWMTSRAAIVVAAGQSPQDVVRGVPRIRYASAGVRITVRPRAAPRPPIARAAGVHLVASREHVEIRAAGATRVEIMADFTQWQPVSLARDGDLWRFDRRLSPGLHRLLIRIDGGPWITPVNLPTIADDLGGVVALLAIP